MTSLFVDNIMELLTVTVTETVLMKNDDVIDDLLTLTSLNENGEWAWQPLVEAGGNIGKGRSRRKAP